MRADFARQGVGNLEAVELGLREALFKDGRYLLEELLRQAEPSLADNSSHPGEKCHPGRAKQAQTLFGPVQLQRSYFYDPASQRGRVPLDQALGLIHGFSPALVRLASRAAAREGYQAASEDLQALAGIPLEGRQIQRLVNQVAPQVAEQLQQGQRPDTQPIPILYVEVDGTGVPMVARELAGRKGKQPDGTAKTREVKLGAVFTQTYCDEEGRPERDYASTTYVGSFEAAEPFGLRIREEARRRGLGRAHQVVFIGDGAAWIWELRRLNFPGAVEILDLYHALEHLHLLCESLYPAQPRWTQKVESTWAAQLKNGQVVEVITAARRRLRILVPNRTARWRNKSPILSITNTGCVTTAIAKPGCSVAPAWWKRAAGQSSDSASRTPACSGPNPAPPASWICVAPSKATAGTNAGIASTIPTASKSKPPHNP